MLTAVLGKFAVFGSVEAEIVLRLTLEEMLSPGEICTWCCTGLGPKTVVADLKVSFLSVASHSQERLRIVWVVHSLGQQRQDNLGSWNLLQP